MDVAVEEVAARKQEDVLGPVWQRPVNRGEDEEEENEVEAVKDHCAAGAPLTRRAGLNRTRRRS